MKAPSLTIADMLARANRAAVLAETQAESADDHLRHITDDPDMPINCPEHDRMVELAAIDADIAELQHKRAELYLTDCAELLAEELTYQLSRSRSVALPCPCCGSDFTLAGADIASHADFVRRHRFVSTCEACD